MRPVPNEGVLDIEAYVPGKSKAPSGVKLYKLSSNETPLGPPPAAREAAIAAAAHLELYPDGQASALKEAIAEVHGLNTRNILCGNGSDELLGLLCQCYLAPGDEAIHTEHGFLVYRIQILARGATPVAAKERDATADVDAILAAVTDRTRLVFLANPNNPTGTYLPFEEVRRLHAGLPGNVILVLDAAYAEYVRKQRLRRRHRAGLLGRERRDDAHLLQDLRARRLAHRLDVRPGADRRRARPGARAVQPERRGDRRRRRRRARPRLRRDGDRPQRPLAGMDGRCAR